MAHTPGEWTASHVKEFKTWEGRCIEASDHVRRVFVREDGCRVTQFICEANMLLPESAANADLIAAAPDLLWALKIVDAQVDEGEPCPVCSTAPHLPNCGMANAIAKAEGR